MADFLSGKLLIASPYLNDPNFMRSVVLIVSHDEEGAFGLSLNRPTDQRLSEIVELSMPKGSVREDDFIYEGGPVEGPLLALHISLIAFIFSFIMALSPGVKCR